MSAYVGVIISRPLSAPRGKPATPSWTPGSPLQSGDSLPISKIVDGHAVWDIQHGCLAAAHLPIDWSCPEDLIASIGLT